MRFDAERAKYDEKAASLRAEILALEEQLKTLAAKHAEALQKINEMGKEFEGLAKERENLAHALRAAESDKRAAERAVKLLEQGKREDRQEIRELQKRLEAQAAEIAVLKSKPLER